jgi:YebC/PmpR family DNA-binding regulatory protein
MAGHSKWANIKHRKERQDKKKGKLFSKLSKMITIAARQGGGEVDKNPDLSLAVDKAKEANMPKDNIERAIKKGTGELEGSEIVSERLEAYGPSGIAIMIDISTDNRNRALSEIRGILRDYDASMAEKGSVSWKFIKRGKIIVEVASHEDRERLLEPIIEAGATDYDEMDDGFLIYTQPSDLHQVKKNLEKNKLKVKDAEFSFEPKNEISVDDKSHAKKILKLMDELGGYDDVDEVYSDFDIAEEIIDQIDI